MKYKLISDSGREIEGLTIDEIAKEDFKNMMDWNELEWKTHTSPILSKDKRRVWEIMNSINELLGFKKYKDKINWSQGRRGDMLRLEKAIKCLKGDGGVKK